MNKKNWIAIILGIVFIGLIILIKTNLIESFDTFCYNLVTFKINNFFTNFYKCFTFLGSTIFIIVLTIFLFFLFLFLKKKNISFIIAAEIIISTLVNNVIKLIIRRPRPTVLALVTEKTFSFPSGHTMAAVTLYGLLLYLVIKSQWHQNIKILSCIFLGLLPLLVGVSRIYLGAHFASDILGGGIASTIILLLSTNYIAKKNLL